MGRKLRSSHIHFHVEWVLQKDVAANIVIANRTVVATASAVAIGFALSSFLYIMLN